MKEQFQGSKWLVQGQKLVADWDSHSNSLTGWTNAFSISLFVLSLETEQEFILKKIGVSGGRGEAGNRDKVKQKDAF